MINPEDLQKAKLNRVQKPVEKSSLSFKTSNSSNWYSEEKEKLAHYRENQILAQLDQWIPFVPKEISFDTVFIDISRPVALKLIKMHDEFISKTKNLEQTLLKFTTGGDIKMMVEQHEKEIVDSLKNELKLDEHIQHLMKQIDECSLLTTTTDSTSSFKEPVFFKLSSRSPKDVVKMNNKDLMSLFYKDLRDNYPSEADQNDNSNRIVAFTRAATELLRISSSDEVLELMLRSTRVNSDLIETYQDFWNEKSPLNKIALRKWDSNIDIRLEFRTFIVNGRLKAISQYNHVVYVEEIEKYHTKIQALIEKSVKYLKENLDKHMIFKHMVADFVIYPRFFSDIVESSEVNEQLIYNGEYIKLIELNPYEESTGACMFSWKTDQTIIPMPPPISTDTTQTTESEQESSSQTVFRFITREFKASYLEKHLDKVVAPEYKFLLV